jgi:hypothetical protein
VKLVEHGRKLPEKYSGRTSRLVLGHGRKLPEKYSDRTSGLIPD